MYPFTGKSDQNRSEDYSLVFGREWVIFGPLYVTRAGIAELGIHGEAPCNVHSQVVSDLYLARKPGSRKTIGNALEPQFLGRGDF